ncbi:sensor histidine kinase KdpD [Cyanobium sp. Morenito 9A2]|uniref:sensor histidine kinase n=1 Tax=Cyanobium sp. Morenito 9A2 TaxID=2823718 RepID=UPI0020CE7591|nr:HAMP domain-containing sensor histidine kinase [Cyanobium sp. Morenito 9A2]MCP9849621.1 sensor histidine kinase [Cyanobium sp. Morenito 9A2]
MQVSERFLALLQQQLAQFTDRLDLRSLVVYLALPTPDGKPSLVPVGAWPHDGAPLPAVEHDTELRLPDAQRRWLALRHEQVLLGALRVETDQLPWSEPLTQRLQATANGLTLALCLDLEQQRLRDQLQRQDQQLRLLVHQLRNPLAALRTFGQLLLRRLDGDQANRLLVKGLLAEEQQLNRYVDAIDRLAGPLQLASGPTEPQPLLLPPSLAARSETGLQELLTPLLQRAAATAALQGRRWHTSDPLPSWEGEPGAVAEILANLLENAFRYSPPEAEVGLLAQSLQAGLRLTVWDGGTPIDPHEREAIFGRGVRGARGKGLAGTGLGLALARDLARSLGGDLRLVVPPAAIDPTLPRAGNAFCLELPPAGAAPRPTPAPPTEP